MSKAATMPADVGRLELAPSSALRWLLIGIVLLPLLVSAVALVTVTGDEYQPTADQALIELRTRNVVSSPPLIGLYSREEWSHPGPAQFYVLALPYWLTGASTVSLGLAALLFNGLSIVGMAVLSRRRGGDALFLCTLVVCGILVSSLGPDFLRDPWNPFMTVLPFGLLVFVVWSSASGEAWALPAGAALASVLVQVHIGYLPLAIPLVLWGAALYFIGARRARRAQNGDGRPWRGFIRSSCVTALVLIVLWSPTTAQQLFTDDGNVTAMVEYFLDPDEEGHDLTDGLRVMFGQLGLTSEWLVGAPLPEDVVNPDFAARYGYPETKSLEHFTIPILLVIFAVTAAAVGRQRDANAGRFMATIAVALVLGVVTVASTVGDLADYRLRWTWIIGALLTAGALWIVVRELVRRVPRATGVMPAALIAATLAVSISSSVAAAGAGTPREPESTRLAALLPNVVSALPDENQPIVIRSAAHTAGLYHVGLHLALERRGYTVLTPAGGQVFGGYEGVEAASADVVLTVALDESVAELSEREDVEMVAFWGTIDRSEYAAVLRRRNALDELVEEGQISDGEWFRRRAELHPGPVVAVFRERRPAE